MSFVRPFNKTKKNCTKTGGGWGEREIERERQTDRQTDRDRER